MKYRYLLLLAACLALGSFAYATDPPPPPQLNCSTIVYSYVGYSEPDGHPSCGQWHWPLYDSYAHNFEFTWSCYTTGRTVQYPNPPVTYASGSKTLLASQTCAYFFVTGTLDCPARFQVSRNVPISAYNGSKPNSMTWTAQPSYITAPSNCANSTGGSTQAVCTALECAPAPGASPIIIDLDDEGFKSLTNPANVATDVAFDWGGQILKTSWTGKGSRVGFLVLPDPAGNVPDASHMFGNYTPQPPIEFPNGFNALSVYDDPKNGGNGNHKIDKGDSVFEHLRVWVDSNHNGKVDPGELLTLEEAGITSISLQYELDSLVVNGNQLRFRGHVSGPLGDHTIYDVFFEGYCLPKK